MKFLERIKKIFSPKKERMYWFWYDDRDWYDAIMDYAKKYKIELNEYNFIFAFGGDKPWIEVFLPGNHGRMIIDFDWKERKAVWTFVDVFDSNNPYSLIGSYVWVKDQDPNHRQLNWAKDFFRDMDIWFERYSRLYDNNKKN